jgi:maleamate amidohydrolase
MGHAGFRPAVVGSRALVDAARAADVPVVLVGSAFDARFREAGTWERKVTHEAIVHGSVWAEFDPDLAQTDTDLVVIKRYPSSFFGTELASTLVSLGVDTVLIGGASTSGCVRATALDAVQHGFRPIVVEQAVADRFALPHLANLFDIDMKIGDVVDLEQAVDYLRSGSPASQAAPSA